MSKSLTNKLLSTQRPLLLSITRAYRTTSTAALCTLAGIPPLHLAVLKEHKRSALLQLKKPVHILDKCYTPSEIETKIPKWKQHPSIAPRGLFLYEERTELPAHIMKIFTDGSKSVEGVAAAFVAFQMPPRQIIEHSVRLGDSNTVFQAEGQAIMEAVQWLSAAQQEEASILTDSLSCYMALQQFRPKNPLIHAIQHFVDEHNLQIHVKWVKAHVGNVGNERADAVAKARACASGREHSLPIPVSHIKKILRQELLENWQNYWTTAETGRRTARFIKKINNPMVIDNRALVLFLSGHGPFPAYLHRFKVSDNENCDCGSVGTADHLLFDCPLTARHHIRPPVPDHESTWLRQIMRSKMLRGKLLHWLQHITELQRYR